jgi:hypothetical protein
VSRTFLLQAAATFDFAFALFHAGFNRIFGWRCVLAPLDFVNRGIVHVMNLALVYLFAAIGAVVLVASHEVTPSPVTSALLWTMAGFWTLRAACQPAYFKLRHPASTALFVLFLLGGVLHGAAAAA